MGEGFAIRGVMGAALRGNRAISASANLKRNRRRVLEKLLEKF